MGSSQKAQKLKVQYRLATGDDLGLVKILDSPGQGHWDQTKVVKTWGKPDRERGVVCFKHFQGNDILISRRDGQIEIMDSKRGFVSNIIHKGKGRKIDNYAVCLDSLIKDNSNSENNNSEKLILSGWLDGNIQFLKQNSEEEQGQNSWEVAASIEIKKKLECMEISRNKQNLAVGCEGQELAIWDVQTQKQTFKFKGSKVDWLGLVDRPWVTCLTWRKQDDKNSQIIIGTGLRKVKLYDLKVKKKPIQEVQFGEARITQVECEDNGNYVWVSNGTGHLFRWDLRTNRQFGGLRGVGGSIRSLRICPFKQQFSQEIKIEEEEDNDNDSSQESEDEDVDTDANNEAMDIDKAVRNQGGDGKDEQKYDLQREKQFELLASVGLDRWCRIHDVEKRTLKAKVFLKQQSTGCTWLPVSKGEKFQSDAPKRNKKDAQEDQLQTERQPKRTKLQ